MEAQQAHKDVPQAVNSVSNSPLELSAEIKRGYDGPLRLLLTLRNTGNTSFLISRDELPWSKISFEDLMLKRNGKWASPKGLLSESTPFERGSDQLEPGQTMAGFVELNDMGKDPFSIAGRLTCEVSTGGIDGPREYVKLSFGPLMVAAAEESEYERERRRRESIRLDDYHGAIQRAMAAVQSGDFHEAETACAEAESFQTSSETRDIRRYLHDRDLRNKYLAAAKKAMDEQDYASAEENYEQANQIEASSQVETEAKKARALSLLKQAKSAISAGDTELALQQLRTSLWLCESEEANKLLDSIRTTTSHTSK